MQAVYEKLQEKEIWEQTLEKYQWKSENLMEILLDIQKTSRCISDECIKYVAEKLQLDRKFLYSYVRCNDCFSTKKRGKYVIRVCNDTGCHFEKSVEILNGIRSELGLSERKDTTDDGMFTVLESRYCLGACAVGPVIEVNDKIYPSMNVEQAKELVSKLRFG